MILDLPGNGHARGILIDKHNFQWNTGIQDLFIGKFTIDVTKEHYMAILYPFQSLSSGLKYWIDSLYQLGGLHSIDSMRGRLCYGWFNVEDRSHHSAVIDFE